MAATRTTSNGAEPEVIESTAVEVYTPAHQPATLFRTDDPTEVIRRASEVANALKSVLDSQGLTVSIQGRQHVQVEGWTTCGAMLGVVPVVEWTRPLQNGWEARVVARTLDGRTIGGAEASCTRAETRWQAADDYAIRGMAQTRATSRALRGPLGFIVTLAGYAATPAEEMQGSGFSEVRVAAPRTTAQRKPSARPITGPQKGKINALLSEAGVSEGEAAAIKQWALGKDGPIDKAPSKGEGSASALIDRLTSEGAQAILGELLAQTAHGDTRAQEIVKRHLVAS